MPLPQPDNKPPHTMRRSDVEPWLEPHKGALVRFMEDGVQRVGILGRSTRNHAYTTFYYTTAKGFERSTDWDLINDFYIVVGPNGEEYEQGD